MGLFSGIKKVFKKVTKAIVKVAPIALLAGAAIFTGGAALGLAPFAGGWGAAAAGFASNLGLTGTLGSIVTGAVTQAGYGALAGGLISGVTGGNVIKGAQMGALTGAVTGGVTGGLGFATDPLGGGAAAGQPGAAAAPGATPATSPTGFASFTPSTSVAPVSGPPVGDLTLGGAAAAPAAAGPATAAAAPVAGTPTGFGSFLDKEVVGRTLAGLGQGYLEGQSAKDERDLQIRLRDDRQASYDIDPAVLQQAPAAGPPRPTPREAYGSRRASNLTARYAFNPETGRIERSA